MIAVLTVLAYQQTLSPRPPIRRSVRLCNCRWTIDSEFLVRSQGEICISHSSKRKIHSSATAKQHGLVAYIVRKYDNNFQGSAIYLESVISLRHFALVCRSGQAIQTCQAVGICCLKIPSHAIDLRFPQGGEPRDARETESSCFTLSRSSGF